MIRMPAVAGQFYEADPSRLKATVEHMVDTDAPRTDAKAVLCPHAGLIYSGPVAGAVYSRVETYDTYILVGPNHTGLGPRISMMAEGAWAMPEGQAEVDRELGARVLKHVPSVEHDSQAHIYEHSLEVQLPFILYFAPKAKILPITILSAGLDELKNAGEGIARAIAETSGRVLVVASSDMSHFIKDEEARSKDRLAIDRVLALDPDGLYNVVHREDISMCGYMPAVVMLAAAKAMGATSAELVRYATSAEVSGDYDRVVGYAGIIVK
jgi:AmmeMemoRadiSam system protein B